MSEVWAYYSDSDMEPTSDEDSSSGTQSGEGYDTASPADSHTAALMDSTLVHVDDEETEPDDDMSPLAPAPPPTPLTQSTLTLVDGEKSDPDDDAPVLVSPEGEEIESDDNTHPRIPDDDEITESEDEMPPLEQIVIHPTPASTFDDSDVYSINPANDLDVLPATAFAANATGYEATQRERRRFRLSDFLYHVAFLPSAFVLLVLLPAAFQTGGSMNGKVNATISSVPAISTVYSTTTVAPTTSVFTWTIDWTTKTVAHTITVTATPTEPAQVSTCPLAASPVTQTVTQTITQTTIQTAAAKSSDSDSSDSDSSDSDLYGSKKEHLVRPRKGTNMRKRGHCRKPRTPRAPEWLIKLRANNKTVEDLTEDLKKSSKNVLQVIKEWIMEKYQERLTVEIHYTSAAASRASPVQIPRLKISIEYSEKMREEFETLLIGITQVCMVVDVVMVVNMLAAYVGGF